MKTNKQLKQELEIIDLKILALKYQLLAVDYKLLALDKESLLAHKEQEYITFKDLEPKKPKKHIEDNPDLENEIREWFENALGGFSGDIYTNDALDYADSLITYLKIFEQPETVTKTLQETHRVKNPNPAFMVLAIIDSILINPLKNDTSTLKAVLATLDSNGWLRDLDWLK